MVMNEIFDFGTQRELRETNRYLSLSFIGCLNPFYSALTYHFTVTSVVPLSAVDEFHEQKRKSS